MLTQRVLVGGILVQPPILFIGQTPNPCACIQRGNTTVPSFLHTKFPSLLSRGSGFWQIQQVLNLRTLPKSSEMEFLNGIFVKVSGHQLESSQTQDFVLIFYPYFSLLQKAIHEQTQVFLFRGFFVRIIKTRVESSFPSNPPVEGTVNIMEQKTRVFLLNCKLN